MENVYLKHYEENKISPVRQNLSNLEKHFYIREKLYEQLGLPRLLIEGKEVLEIGAGSGYNSIVTANLNPKKYTIVEPNSTAITHMTKLFKSHNLDSKIQIENELIENYSSENKYDIIIAEGFMPAINNKFDVLDKMNSLLKPNGIMIITTADNISLFYEIARRFLANMLLKKNSEKTYEEKISILVNAFSSHLDTLKGFSRLKEDWCADVLTGDALYQHELSPSDAIDYLRRDFYFYNISPNIIKDETWFKEVPQEINEFNQNKINNFLGIWHNLFHYKVFKEERKEELNLELINLCTKFTKLAKMSEYNDYSNNLKKDLLKTIESIKNNIDGTSDEIIESLNDFYKIIDKDDFTSDAISNLSSFKRAFGRGQQYISFIKKGY